MAYGIPDDRSFEERWPGTDRSVQFSGFLVHEPFTDLETNVKRSPLPLRG